MCNQLTKASGAKALTLPRFAHNGGFYVQLIAVIWKNDYLGYQQSQPHVVNGSN
jgi:hypothetical protein